MKGSVFQYCILLLLCLLSNLWLDLSALAFIHCFFFVALLFEFLLSSGKVFPVLYATLIFFYLIYVIAPIMVYNFLHGQVNYPMTIAEGKYLEFITVIVMFFAVGLFIPFGAKLNFNRYNFLYFIQKAEKQKNITTLSFVFIAVGLVSGSISAFVPSSLGFLFFLLDKIKFVGAFMLLFSTYRFKYVVVAAVYVFFGLKIIAGGVFYELFVWAFFLLMFLDFKFKISLTLKIVILIASFSLISIIQSVKHEYRNIVWYNKSQASESNVNVFYNLFVNKVTGDAGMNARNTNDEMKEKGGVAGVIDRLNQGWIIALVLNHVPSQHPFENGELFVNDVTNSLLPRFLFPQKAAVGGDENQAKFERYTGRRLVKATTMRISLLGDAYVNFGYYGAGIFMFFVAIAYRYIAVLLLRLSATVPILIFFIPYVFSYVIRNTDVLATLNYIVKGGFLIFVIYILVKNQQALSRRYSRADVK